MNSNLSRFKISSLIAMARTTEDMEQRERYISLAEEELDIIRTRLPEVSIILKRIDIYKNNIKRSEVKKIGLFK